MIKALWFGQSPLAFTSFTTAPKKSDEVSRRTGGDLTMVFSYCKCSYHLAGNENAAANFYNTHFVPDGWELVYSKLSECPQGGRRGHVLFRPKPGGGLVALPKQRYKLLNPLCPMHGETMLQTSARSAEPWRLWPPWRGPRV